MANESASLTPLLARLRDAGLNERNRNHQETMHWYRHWRSLAKDAIAALQQAQQSANGAERAVAVVVETTIGVEIVWFDPPSSPRPPAGTKLYTAQPPLPEGVSEEEFAAALKAYDDNPTNEHAPSLLDALESYRARLAARGEKGVHSNG